MAEPKVFDARHGLTADLLEGLRQAQRVSLAVKDLRTSALGFWVGDELRVALVDSDPLLLHVRRVSRAELASGQTHVFRPQGVRPKLGVIFSTENAESDAFWSRLIGVVREGDTLRIAEDFEKPGLLQVQVFAGGSRVASLRVPRRQLKLHTARSVA